MIHIQPILETLNQWAKVYVPDRDVFYLLNEDLVLLSDFLSQVLVMPAEEFFKHSEYNAIQMASSYEYWNRSKLVAWVAVAPEKWFPALSSALQWHLTNRQVQLKRGLWASEETLWTCNAWNLLPDDEKTDFLLSEVKEWDDGLAVEVPTDLPEHLKVWSNVFPVKSGGNCLSATLFAITKEEVFLGEWIHQGGFLQTLKQSGYEEVNADNLEGADAVLWVDEQGAIQHASYHIGKGLFFNKDGQTFFNPWKLANRQMIDAEWGHLKPKVWRAKE